MPVPRRTELKEKHLESLKKIGEKFVKEIKKPVEEMTRDYYRKNADPNFSRSWETLYNTFTDFKQDAFEISENFDLEKKILLLEEENKKLKKDKDELLKTSNFEDDIINKYEKTILPLQIPKPIKITEVKKNKNTEAVLVLSDFHLGEVVISEEVNYANEYNSKIMIKRLDRIFYYFIYYCKKFEITNIHLWFLGDLLSGSIHEELVRTNEMNEVDAVFFLQEYITKKLLEIESHFNSITCEFLVGNHSRLSIKPQFKTAHKLNWEYVLAKQLSLCFDLIQGTKNKIKINVSNSLFKIVNISKRKFLITHGTFMSGGGSGGFAGVPFYALASNSAKMYGVLHQIGVSSDQIFDDIQIGHLHSTASIGLFNGNSCRVNGCIIGTNEFSLHKIKSVAKIEQTMLIIQEGCVNQEITLRGNIYNNLKN